MEKLLHKKLLSIPYIVYPILIIAKRLFFLWRHRWKVLEKLLPSFKNPVTVSQNPAAAYWEPLTDVSKGQPNGTKEGIIYHIKYQISIKAKRLMGFCSPAAWALSASTWRWAGLGSRLAHTRPVWESLEREGVREGGEVRAKISHILFFLTKAIER
jgi:hypothetical protein